MERYSPMVWLTIITPRSTVLAYRIIYSASEEIKGTEK